MSNTNQVEVVKRALDLMQRSEKARREIQDYNQQAEIKRPQKREVKKQPYPKVQSQYKFWPYLLIITIASLVLLGVGSTVESLLICGLGFLWLPAILVFYFGFYSKRKAEAEERLRSMPEYQKACRDIDAAYEEEVRQAEEEFAAAEKNYNEAILPGIRKEITARRRLAEDCEAELKALFEASRIIPKQYQNIPALRYLYDMMSTSEYDIKEAIDSYERNQTRMREEEAMRLQAEANAIEDAKVSAMEEQNYIAERARRDQRRQAAVNMVQNHNRNKSLDRISKR